MKLSCGAKEALCFNNAFKPPVSSVAVSSIVVDSYHCLRVFLCLVLVLLSLLGLRLQLFSLMKRGLVTLI